MFDNVDWLPDNFVISDGVLSLLASSLILIVTVVILRALTTRFIQRTVNSPELRGRWLVNSRNGFLLLLLLGLVMIWGEELRTLALSIVAIAVAFVVATKELILCFTGSLLKSGSRSFVLGDRIQIKDLRGDVIDQNLLATTILEVGPGKHLHQRTGRRIVIPNALFVSEPVINESFTTHYDFHVFTVPFKREDNWQAAQQALLASAARHCEPYLELVRRYMSKIGNQRGLMMPSVDPRVTIQVPVAGEIHLTVRIPAKAGERNFIEQAILTEVFSENDFSRRREPAEQPVAAD
ncbi:Miniconductance mechanosensitive channel MscM precursor [Pseudomonas saudimassiliensis]|uniref:Miniconductance mechanosensitive channel MscM n=1 Tax=Pseudomonas saudimassiliensis TaxID=1461581 RepID=A0A078MGI5_9PSED|nr:mechanosensitive ion channel domain-containing protein [Pseudomonas saudimassiliensis]CEA05400.1 Miniconductance mechanosensitive channel MscM precursor [Pseudomonas saudimassiliensis]CEF27115.1 Miniconductance mechanosensitive channel MscM precursor [Pseudomonas saudimassiliensis]